MSTPEMPIDRDEFSNAMNVLRGELASSEGRIMTGIAGVHSRLDALNGRTRRSEERIAVAETKVAVVEKALEAVHQADGPFTEMLTSLRERLATLETRVTLYAVAGSTVAWLVLDKGLPLLAGLVRGGQ